MKQLLIVFICLLGFCAQAQTSQPSAVRFYRVGDQIKITDPTGATLVGTYPVNLVIVRTAGKVIETVLNGASEYYTPDKFLNASGAAYGTSVVASLLAFNATLPTSTGGGGIATASFGTTTTSTTTFVASSGAIATSGYFYILIQNVGANACTINYGTVNIPLGAGEERAFPARLDATTNKYAPYPSLSITMTSGSLTTVNVLKTPTQ